MEALLEPIKQRWRFHFEGERATNRLDKVRRVRQPFVFASSEGLTFLRSFFVLCGCSPNGPSPISSTSFTISDPLWSNGSES